MQRLKRGDTIIEVSIAITIFAMVAALAISMMNSGIATAQGALETSMARNEVDAQAEAIRFIHDSYTSERSLSSDKQTYKKLWHRLLEDADSNTSANLPDLQQNATCADSYDASKSKNIYNNHAFIVNTRNINPANVNQTVLYAAAGNSTFADPALYPRIIFAQNAGANPDTTTSDSADELTESLPYKQVARAEGIWVIAIQDSNHTVPQFYDFHIYTCWLAPGQTVPSTIGTILRLYNPELTGS